MAVIMMCEVGKVARAESCEITHMKLCYEATDVTARPAGMLARTEQSTPYVPLLDFVVLAYKSMVVVWWLGLPFKLSLALLAVQTCHPQKSL